MRNFKHIDSPEASITLQEVRAYLSATATLSRLLSRLRHQQPRVIEQVDACCDPMCHVMQNVFQMVYTSAREGCNRVIALEMGIINDLLFRIQQQPAQQQNPGLGQAPKPCEMK